MFLKLYKKKMRRKKEFIQETFCQGKKPGKRQIALGTKKSLEKK